MKIQFSSLIAALAVSGTVAFMPAGPRAFGVKSNGESVKEKNYIKIKEYGMTIFLIFALPIDSSRLVHGGG